MEKQLTLLPSCPVLIKNALQNQSVLESKESKDLKICIFTAILFLQFCISQNQMVLSFCISNSVSAAK
jgi:hypothetical protein